MSFIAIDIGGSFIKGAVIDVDKLRLSRLIRITVPNFISVNTSFREINPQKIIAKVSQLIEKLLVHALPCEGIILCNQMHGFVLADSKSNAVSNFISWQDQRSLMQYPKGRRGRTYFAEMKGRIHPEMVLRCGNELKPGSPASVLYWHSKQQDSNLAGTVPTGIGDFITAKLTQSNPVTDITNAAAHGLYNLLDGKWDAEMISGLGLEKMNWPEIKPHGSIAGFYRINNKKIPIYTSCGDHQCAILGVLIDDDELSLNIATGSQVSILRTSSEFGNYQTRPFFENKYLRTVTHIPAGRSLNALINLLTELPSAQNLKINDPWPYIENRASKETSSNLKVAISFFPGAFGNSGFIKQIREDNLTIGHLFNSVFQNMVCNYYSSAMRLAPFGTYRRLVFSGGLINKSKLLQDMLQQRFQLPYRLSPHNEDTLMGLMALSLYYSKRVKCITDAVKIMREKFILSDSLS